jgi:chromosome segregation protein
MEEDDGEYDVSMPSSESAPVSAAFILTFTFRHLWKSNGTTTQPEDDVDSKLIKNIIEQIWKAKSKRQLIFASHNANFVVNGDSELVVCCDYVKAGDQTGGQIKCAGAIDNETIKEEITTVTEGGKLAFKLRMDKYGF